jgi:hypothetical protein
MKKYAQKVQDLSELPSYQHLILGGVSGAMGMFVSFFFPYLFAYNMHD